MISIAPVSTLADTNLCIVIGLAPMVSISNYLLPHRGRSECLCLVPMVCKPVVQGTMATTAPPPLYRRLAKLEQNFLLQYKTNICSSQEVWNLFFRGERIFVY